MGSPRARVENGLLNCQLHEMKKKTTAHLCTSVLPRLPDPLILLMTRLTLRADQRRVETCLRARFEGGSGCREEMSRLVTRLSGSKVKGEW